MRAEIGIDDAVAPDAQGVGALERQKAVVAVFDVGGRRKVDRRRQSPAAQYRGDVNRNANALASPQAAGIALLPVAAGRTFVEKMGVYVDEGPYASSSSVS
jgi:hypothetical protein